MMNVGLALAVCNKMELFASKDQKLIFKFVGMYDQDKILKILEKAQTYTWWRNNPQAAFMKAVGETNRAEKAEADNGRVDKTS
jgi:hypothetical protein